MASSDSKNDDGGTREPLFTHDHFDHDFNHDIDDDEYGSAAVDPAVDHAHNAQLEFQDFTHDEVSKAMGLKPPSMADDGDDFGDDFADDTDHEQVFSLSFALGCGLHRVLLLLLLF
eukprot:m.168361 g.168361  ORF g.168361 m.168361 type:complete len:116 (-) comp18203_c0_seq3:123-470(-)